MADLKYSKEYRELQFMVMRYNTLMGELKNFGQSRRSIYHKHSDNFENDSIKQSESEKEALEIQKAEIMSQLTKIREFVYVNGGCPDEDLLPLMPESQRKKHRESTSSIGSISSIADLKTNYYPPQPSFGPFNKSLTNVIENTTNDDDSKNTIINIDTFQISSKKPKFIASISANLTSNNNYNSNRNDTPLPTNKKKNKHITSNLIAAFSAPQHLKTQSQQHTSILKEKSLNNLNNLNNLIASRHNIKTPPSRSISQSTSTISIPNSTTTEEIADIVDIKLEELNDNDNDNDSDSELHTDSDSESDTIFPLSMHMNAIEISDPNAMSLRAQLWSVLLDFNFKEHQHKEYIKEIEKGNSMHYNNKILRDAQRTFLTSSEFNSRVSEHQIVRILNAFVIKNNRAYCQGMDAIAGIMLYVMHETYAFQLLNVLMKVHFPLYFKSDKDKHKSNYNINCNIPTINISLIGAYSGTYLAWDILKIYDLQLFQYLYTLHPYQYIFPLIASFQAISQPLSQVQKLWDYLFAYGVYLNPIVSVAQLIVNRKKILMQKIPNLLMGLLSQRKWMNNRLNAKNVIKISSLIANKLSSNKQYKEIWINVQLHSSDFNTAYKIKSYYDLKLKSFINNNSQSDADDDDESSDWNQSDSDDEEEEHNHQSDSDSTDTDTDSNSTDTNTDSD